MTLENTSKIKLSSIDIEIVEWLVMNTHSLIQYI